MWTLLLAFALAADPTSANIDHDGAIIGIAHVEGVSAEEVRKKLADPRFVSKIHGGRTEMTVEPGGGDCLIVGYTSPNPILTARYTIKRCPHQGGFRGALIESPTFQDYSTRWSLTETDSGVEIRYRLFLVPKVMVPTSLVRSSARKSIAGLMKKLHAHFKQN